MIDLTYPAGRAPTFVGPPPFDPSPAPRGAPGAFPVPAGRGRWRITAHRRVWARAASTTWQSTILADLGSARGRRLDQAWNTPATLTFTVDGRSPEAALVRELSTDVYAWRWDDTAGRDVAVFRGIVTQSEDQISEQSHVVTFTAHDYAAMLERRFEISATPTVWAAADQDVISQNIVHAAGASPVGSWAGQAPGAYLPLEVALCNPDGTTRALSGTVRDRTYIGGSSYFSELDDLARVVGGFDYDVVPETRTAGMVAPVVGAFRDPSTPSACSFRTKASPAPTSSSNTAGTSRPLPAP